MKGWRTYCDFKSELEPGVALRHKRYFDNLKSNAIINRIVLFGYENGDFNIILKPVNAFTAPILVKKFKAVDTKKLDVRVYIDNTVYLFVKAFDDLKLFISHILDVEVIEPELIHEIENTFRWFKDVNQRKTIVLSPEDPIKEKIFFEDITKIQVELRAAIEMRNYETVKKLMTQGLSPNIGVVGGETVIHYAVWEYIFEKDLQLRKELLKIIKELLDYGADYSKKHLHFDKTALTCAAEWGETELVDLMLKYTKELEFGICEEKDTNKTQVVATLKKHGKRIGLFADQASKVANSGKTDVKISKPKGPALVHTTFSQNNFTIDVDTLKTIDLSAEEFDDLFKLYKANFNSTKNLSEEEAREHFKEKLGMKNPDKKVFIDVLRDRGKIIGFDMFEIYKGTFKGKPYLLNYGNLTYLEKPYRGTRIISLLGMRSSVALKAANPNTETYRFYDAIHPNSYRIAMNMDLRYPEIRTDESAEFVKHATTPIYGAERVSQFDGKKHVFWPTDSRVQGNDLDPNKYDLPSVLSMFDDKTKVEGRQMGGVPVVIPIVRHNFDRIKTDIDNKLNNTIFEEHCLEWGKLMFGDCTLPEKWSNSVECLWPDNKIVRERVVQP